MRCASQSRADLNGWGLCSATPWVFNPRAADRRHKDLREFRGVLRSTRKADPRQSTPRKILSQHLAQTAKDPLSYSESIANRCSRDLNRLLVEAVHHAGTFAQHLPTRSAQPHQNIRVENGARGANKIPLHFLNGRAINMPDKPSRGTKQ